MVIGPGKGGIAAFVILADGEHLPARLNSEKVLVFRQGDSTNRELRVLKPLGELASEDVLGGSQPDECPGLLAENDPVHTHEGEVETWWFYDNTWTVENGPYGTREQCEFARGAYLKLVEEAKEKEVLTIDSLTGTILGVPESETE